MLFATLVIEREPLSWADLPIAVSGWLQSVGSVAAVGLFIWGIAYLSQRRPGEIKPPASVKVPFLFFIALTLAGYATLIFLFLASWLGMNFAAARLPSGDMAYHPRFGDYLLTATASCALLAIFVPFVHDLIFRIRAGRVWAMARLSLKEAVRSRVVFIFSAIAIIFLFADWFVPYRRGEDQVRNYVRVVFWSMLPLFFMTASLLGAMSIPNDIRSLSIHTIVTKPVEKFEIVLGRFLGYGLVITLGLAGVGILSYIYILSGVDPDAQDVSYKARVPHFGNLSFFRARQTNEETLKGVNAGRIWNYRSYIGGASSSSPNSLKPYAIFSFDGIPPLDDGPVRIEYTFDIFRLTKGRENEAVSCTFTFADGRYLPVALEPLMEKVRREKSDRMNETKGSAQGSAKHLAIDEAIIAQHGVYETHAQVTDYHTQYVEVPAALFRKLIEMDKTNPRVADDFGRTPPLLRVFVSLDLMSQAQMLGMAKRDMYILTANRPFWQNFFKGLVGLWCIFILVLGVAIGCSTYLNGIISWLSVMFLIGTGLFRDFIRRVAEGASDTTGPMESVIRMTSHIPIAVKLQASPTTTVVEGADAFFKWMLQLFLNLVPDINRFDLNHYVANGFDIPWTSVLLLDNLVPVAAYLIPWSVLAFYLMKSREIANPT